MRWTWIRILALRDRPARARCIGLLWYRAEWTRLVEVDSYGPVVLAEYDPGSIICDVLWAQVSVKRDV